MVTSVKPEEHGEPLGPVLHQQELFMNRSTISVSWISSMLSSILTSHLALENSVEKYWLPQEQQQLE